VPSTPKITHSVPRRSCEIFYIFSLWKLLTINKENANCKNHCQNFQDCDAITWRHGFFLAQLQHQGAAALPALSVLSIAHHSSFHAFPRRASSSEGGKTHGMPPARWTPRSHSGWIGSWPAAYER
jgi:hypothetical protein